MFSSVAGSLENAFIAPSRFIHAISAMQDQYEFSYWGTPMTNKLTLLVALPVVAGLVTACGGGGGGSGPMQLAQPAPTKPNNVAAPKPTPPTIPAKPSLAKPNGKAHFVFVPRSGTLGFPAVKDRTSSAGTPIKVSESETFATIKVQDERVTDQKNLPLTHVTVVGGVRDGEGRINQTSQGFFASFRRSGPNGGSLLDDARYGVIGDFSNPALGIGGYHYGKATPVDQLPVDTSATYAGSFYGYGATIGEPIPTSDLVGRSKLTANFGTGKVNGAITDLQTTKGVLQPYGLSMNGKISGNTYSGTAAFTTPAGAPAGTVTSSAMTGGFYGANAGETAGALRVEGRRPGSGSRPAVIVGGFGGTRQPDNN